MIFAKFQLAASILVYAGVAAYFICYVVNYRRDRWYCAAMVSCMFLPYVWLIGYREVGGMMPMILARLFTFPALFPTLMISAGLRQHFTELPGIAVLLTAVQLGIGLWMIRLGPKHTIAVLVYSLLASLFGSFFLNGGVRI